MAIGEILLSAALQVLFEKLASLGLDYAQRKGAPPISGVSIDLFKKWKTMLDTINSVLEDAEDKQLSGNHLVKQWMDDVRDMVYDIEDLLDEFEIQAAQAKSKAESNTSGGLVTRTFPYISQPKSVWNPNPCSLVSEIEVQKMNERFEEIITRKDRLSLTENVVSRYDYPNKRIPSTSLSEPRFFGREKEEAEILELLTGEAENSDNPLKIIPIIGMGGVGKTAFAQRLYNDTRVSSCFEKRAWVCVSDVFDILGITKTILRSLTDLPSEGLDLNTSQVKLKDSLSGKKFLLVLDDVWNENYGEWFALLKPFQAGAKGSKVIVTTRNRAVVSVTGALPYALEGLSIDNCTNLLAFHALGTTNFEKHPDLEAIGKKLAEKCKGSPLAARVLGGLLRDKRNFDQWEAILNNKTWDLSMGENDEVLRVLKVSYAHLPSYLKRCFAYCAVFPKDYEIERDELVLLWMAEGFLDEKRAKGNIFKLGQAYFDELVSRSFLQQSSVNISKFSMHDLLNDLAKSIAGGTCFTTSWESQLASNEDAASLEKTRYASLSSPWVITLKCTRVYHRMKVLRSYMLLCGRSDLSMKCDISNKVLHDLLTELKYLRVFTLCRCSIIEIPNCVGDLKHLRYLNFSYTDIERLPESIVGLCKLQALILRGCEKLSRLPPGITEMVSLQFLDIRDTTDLKEMPPSISNLKNLIILSKFIVGTERGSQLKELKSLSYLQGELSISELQKVEDSKDAVDANLFEKQGLSKLSLHWDEDFRTPRKEKRESQVLNHLRPYTNLENLTISYYGGATFPSWLVDRTYSKMVSLCLRGCPNITSLPSLGQLPSLRELSLQGLDMVTTIGSEFYGSKRPFSSLITLEFVEMMTWKDWSHHAAIREEEAPFYGLQHLVVRCCPSLIGTLPRQLDHLMKLEIHSCPHLNNSFGEICLPSLRELYLEECGKEILTSLVNLTSLTVLEIGNLMELACFDGGFTKCLVKLKELRIKRCDKLAYLWQDGVVTQSLTCLQQIEIESCLRFTSFVVGEEEIELPCILECMKLWDCASLEKLPIKINSVKDLRIWDCPKFTMLNIPQDGPDSNPMPRLESLYIYRCELFKSFSIAKDTLAALKKLNIGNCQGLESLEEIPVDTMESLESLFIYNCENLRSLPLRCLHTLSHLTSLTIRGCPELEVEEEEFPPLPITLSYLELEDCPKIRCLPNQWHHLSSLHDIYINNCQGIECFPKGGFPLNLRSLCISGCENVKQPVREWGLPFLTSLQRLTIDGISMGGGDREKVCFPSQEKEDNDDDNAWSLLFPPSLTVLLISDMRNVERLSSGLRSHLSSLMGLCISNCPKLRDLPEDGLPPSLQEFFIDGCPILEDRCSKLTGHYWPLIQHIPSICIDEDRI